MRILLFAIVALATSTIAGHSAGIAKLAAGEANAWKQWLCPLPREVTLTGKLTVPVANLRIRLADDATDLDRNLRREFSDALKATEHPDLGEPRAFLDFRRQPGDREFLGSKRNSDQAYSLEMVGGERGVTATCHALTDRGSYFGMKTLKQLLLPTVRGEGATATVDVPLGRIVDWPDLGERGQWGGSAVQDLAWLTDAKYNLLEVHADVTVDKQGVGHAAMKPETLAACAKYGVKVVPIIHHLEQLVNVGLFEAYPMIEAKDADNRNPNQKVICFAQPEIVKPLTDWLVDLSKVPGVTEVMIWLSEEGKGCQCEQCRKAVRYVQELNACVKALREAQKISPKLGLRVLLTQGSYSQNDKVLAALPPDVKVSYYHGGLTYNTERKPMIYPALMPYLAQKRWMGVYPTLSANWLTVAPFSNPEFTHYRLAEFVDKGLSNIVGYIVPTDLYFQVNTEGGLEWAWNAHGRTPHEFAVSFAVRHGLKDPAEFAHWTELIGPVAWDLYESNYPYYEHWGNPTINIAAGKTKAELGGAYFRDFKTEDHFVKNLASCDEALKLAKGLGDPQFIAETKIIQGYTLTLQSVYQLSKVVHGDAGVKPEDRAAAQKWFDSAMQGLDGLSAVYPLWSRTCQTTLSPEAPGRFTDTITMMEKLAANLGELMEKCGFVDAGKPYRLHVIGAWKTEEFAKDHSQTRRLNVTGLIDGPGKYAFRPVYRSGTLGLSASQVALVSSPKGKPDETREEALDKHTCHAGAWVKGDVYTLELKAYDPTRDYMVVADISGGDSTAGDFLFRKLR